ncbi:helix-turn-helix domain-containing protein [Achromobacter insolitus]|uniref:helix-turn-helix domain-containing protein n=1 Tax=Achromobacter insolitus TaxID=217204 RepID=UPI00355869EE
MNWKSIVQELRSSGLTQAQIAAEVGVRQSTIAGILSGAQKDMRWSNGERLRSLHARRTRQLTPPQVASDAGEGGHA